MGEQEQERGGGGERRKGKGETIINEYSEVLVQNVFVVQSGTIQSQFVDSLRRVRERIPRCGAGKDEAVTATARRPFTN